jgi:putative ABC transport system substrate-binding protein
MHRRRFLLTSLAGCVTAPLGAGAQPSLKVPRIGYLVIGSLESPQTRMGMDAFRQGLREHGYVEGQNITVEFRGADSKTERLPGLATELVHLKVDLIVAAGTPVARAVQQATTVIPIVAQAMGDPVGDQLVASLARPGGNVTGSTFLGPELIPKRLALLKEALPTVSRVAALWHPGAFGEPTTKRMLNEAEAAARTQGLRLELVGVRGPDEFDRAFSTMTRQRAEAVIVFPSPMFFNERQRLANLAAKYRLPSMYNAKEFVELGGLITYGASIIDLNRRAATYVDRILKGAKPGDLPVEQPTKFELVINLKTAKALGLTIPPSLLLRADQVIE